MKITKKIAAATLVPAAAAGITVSSLAVASADQPGGRSHAASGHPLGQADRLYSAAQAAHKSRPRPARGHRKASKAAANSVNHARPAMARAHHAAHNKAHVRGHAEAPRQAHAKPAPATQPAGPSSTSMFAGMSAFERCVAWRESGNNPAASSAGLFGILPSTWASLGYPGTAGTSSVALQKQAFNRLYAMYGTSPWAPYDGC